MDFSQFQVIDVETKETDASGNCLVSYKSIDQLSFSKSKKDCYTSKELESKVKKSSDSVLGGKVSSSRTSTYKLSADLAVLESVTNFEHHEFVMNIKKEAGSTVSATQHLTLNGIHRFLCTKYTMADVLKKPKRRRFLASTIIIKR